MMCLHLLLDLLSQKQIIYTQNQSNVIQRDKIKDAFITCFGDWNIVLGRPDPDAVSDVNLGHTSRQMCVINFVLAPFHPPPGSRLTEDVKY